MRVGPVPTYRPSHGGTSTESPNKHGNQLRSGIGPHGNGLIGLPRDRSYHRLVIELRPLVEGDVAAHMAGEDAAVIEWLTGAAATWDSTARHFEMLAANAARGVGKRGFGVWLDEELAV